MRKIRALLELRVGLGLPRRLSQRPADHVYEADRPRWLGIERQVQTLPLDSLQMPSDGSDLPLLGLASRGDSDTVTYPRRAEELEIMRGAVGPRNPHPDSHRSTLMAPERS